MTNQYNSVESLREIMPDANEFMVERIKKLEKLNELGINPYPYSYKETVHSKYIIDNFHTFSEEENFNLAGRAMLIRRMGNATFANISDQDGDIQVYFGKNQVGVEAYNVLKLKKLEIS